MPRKSSRTKKPNKRYLEGEEREERERAKREKETVRQTNVVVSPSQRLTRAGLRGNASPSASTTTSTATRRSATISSSDEKHHDELLHQQDVHHVVDEEEIYEQQEDAVEHHQEIHEQVVAYNEIEDDSHAIQHGIQHGMQHGMQHANQVVTYHIDENDEQVVHLHLQQNDGQQVLDEDDEEMQYEEEEAAQHHQQAQQQQQMYEEQIIAYDPNDPNQEMHTYITAEQLQEQTQQQVVDPNSRPDLMDILQTGLAPDLVIAEAVEVLITMYQCKYCSKRFDTIDKVKGHYLKRHFGGSMGTSGYTIKFQDASKQEAAAQQEGVDHDYNNQINEIPNESTIIIQTDASGNIAGILSKEGRKVKSELPENLQIKVIPSGLDNSKDMRKGRPKRGNEDGGDKPVRYKEPPRQYACPFEGCSYIAKYRSNLWDHKKTHTGEKPYPCSWPGCSSRFTQAQQLKLHLRSHTGEKPFACTWPGCNARFSQKPGLKAHHRTHTGEKPFECDWPGCEWKFRLKGALTDHKRAVHENLKSFICEWPGCNKRFLQSCHLRKHMMSHADIKPYACDWPGCDYRAVTLAYVTNHRKSHTGEKNYECKFSNCGKKFTKSSHVIRHQHRFHPDASFEVITTDENIEAVEEY